MEGQESWVLNMLSEKRDGFYLEIGSGHPEIGSNTLLLEQDFNWSGLGIDIDSRISDTYNLMRNNKCINADAISIDYRKVLSESGAPKQIDYLQIDVDNNPLAANLLALVAIPLTEYRFSVITIEHGCVTDYKNEELRNCQRTILSAFGYRLIVQGINEDWWVDAAAVPYEKYGTLFAVGVPWFCRPSRPQI